MLAFAIVFSGLILAMAILFAIYVLWNMFVRLEELGHLFFAVARSNLGIELSDRDLTIPEWLIVETEVDDKQEADKVIRLIKKDKTEV